MPHDNLRFAVWALNYPDHCVDKQNTSRKTLFNSPTRGDQIRQPWDLTVLAIALVALSVLVLLPGGLIFWLLWAGFSLGILIVLTRHAFSGNTSRTRSLVDGVVLLVILVVFGPVGILVSLALAIVTILSYPIAFNLGLSFLAVRFIPVPLFAKVPVLVLLSLMLALNVRLPGLLTDWLNWKQGPHVSKSRVLELSQDQSLSVVSNTETLSFREAPFQSLSLAGDEGCGCMYWLYPKLITEKIDDSLQKYGVRYRKGEGGAYKLVIDVNQMHGVLHVRMSMWDGAEQTASYQETFRATFPFEEDFGPTNSREVDDLSRRLLFISQNTVWDHLFGSTLAPSRLHPLAQFLSDSIRVSGPPATIEHIRTTPITLQGELVAIDKAETTYDHMQYLDVIGAQTKGCSGQASLGNNGKSATVTFTHDGDTVTIIAAKDLVGLACTTEAVYAIGPVVVHHTSARLGESPQIQIQKFSKRGVWLAHHLVRLPPQTFVGFPRKPIINFLDLREDYQFTLLDVTSDGGRYTVKSASRFRASNSS